MRNALRSALASAILLAALLWLVPVFVQSGSPHAPTVPARFPEGFSPAPPGGERTVLPDSTAVHPAGDVARFIFEYSNQLRRDRHLSELRWDPNLARIAEAHSHDMLQRDYMDHITPEGVGPEGRVSRGDRRFIGLVSENVWKGWEQKIDPPDVLARSIVDGWMASKEHREKLLEPNRTHLGVGVEEWNGAVTATQLFTTARAFLDAPFPGELPPGGTLSLRARSYQPSDPGPIKMDLWSVEGGVKAAGPYDLEGAHIEATPGVYRSRFYFPRPGGDGYTIYNGPQIIAPGGGGR